jgi:Peroxisomal biogenesis factor 11 (PEX11)
MSSVGESSKAPISPSLSSLLSDPSAPSTLLLPSPLLDKLSKWLWSLTGTDQLIMLVQYTLDIITYHADNQTPIGLLLFLNFGGPAKKVASAPSPTSVRLHKFSQLLADARILLRLHGIIPTYQWFLATHASPPSDPTLALVAKLQTYANLLYFPLENAAYLASHAIIPMSKHSETQCWVWSCRFWAAHVAVEFVRLYRERQIHLKGKEKEKQEDAEWQKRWYASLIMNLAYAPQTLHWSLEDGLLEDINVAYLGVIAALSSIYQGWLSL